MVQELNDRLYDRLYGRESTSFLIRICRDDMKINSQLGFWGLALIFCSAILAGCSGEAAPQVVQEDVEIIPAMPGATVDVQPVSQRSVSSPQVSLKPGDQHYFVKSIELQWQDFFMQITL